LKPQADATLAELCNCRRDQNRRLRQSEHDVRELQLLNLPPKKSFARQTTRNPRFKNCEPNITQDEATLRLLVKHLKFIDESGAHLGLTRLFGVPPWRTCDRSDSGYSGKPYT